MKNCAENRVLSNQTNNLVSRKAWPWPSVEDQEGSVRNAGLPQMTNRRGQTRLRTLLQADGFAGYRRTIDNDHRESFHCAMGMILAVAQCFGIMPLAGLRSESPKMLVFRLVSPRTAYAFAITIMLSTMISISIINTIQAVETETCHVYCFQDAFEGVYFYTITMLEIIFFIWLAPRWISLQRDWRSMEIFLDRSLRNDRKSLQLRWKLSMITAVVMTAGLLKNLLYMQQHSLYKSLSSVKNSTVEGTYNYAKEIFATFGNKVGTFIWNFMDLFIMLVSTGLAERYKMLNQRLIGKISTCHRDVDWHEFRKSYAILSTLVKTVDDHISPIILLSFATNLSYICIQLLNGISLRDKDIVSTVYFFGSFVFIVFKTVAVTLLAARINDHSRLALPALYNCPGPLYDMEAQRLQLQLATDEVCLTGMRFFSVTRNFMLAIASAIVTYEVLLLNSPSS